MPAPAADASRGGGEAAVPWALPGRLVVRLRACQGLRNVQRMTFIVGKQDPYVETALVLASTTDLAAEAQRRKRALVHEWTDKVLGKSRDVSDLSDTELVKLCYNATKWRRTRAIKHGGVDPQWKDDDADDWGRTNCTYFRYPGRDPRKSTAKKPIRLAVRVVDAETSGRDREIGMGFVDLEALLSQASQFVPASCTLENNAGTVHLEICLEPWSPLAMRGTLHLTVHKAQGLRRVATLGTEDPFVLAELFPWGVVSRTATKVDGGLFPRWDSEEDDPIAAQLSLAYPGLDDPAAAANSLGLGVRLTVFDEMKLRRNRPMGRAWIGVADIIAKGLAAPATTDKGKSGNQTDAEGSATTSGASPMIVDLWDCRSGVEPCGNLQLDVRFEPGYSVEEQSSPSAPTAGGRRRALLIGINYVGQGENELRGCHNDVREVQSMLQKDFKTVDIRVLVDDPSKPKTGYPTARNIRIGLRWLLEGAAPGDCLFLHYSGHGSQVPDEDGDEDDGRDETLVPVDFSSKDPSTFITDDELRASFFEEIPRGVDLTVVFDCCHSGTLSDFKVLGVSRSVSSSEALTSNNAAAPDPPLSAASNSRSRFLPPCEALVKRMDELRGSRASDAGRSKKRAAPSSQQQRSRARQGASFVVVSGCRDDQTAADAHIDGQFIGATTWAVRETMRATSDGQLALDDFLKTLRKAMKSRGFQQDPQITLGSAKAPSSRWMEAWTGARALAPQVRIDTADEEEGLVSTSAERSLADCRKAASPAHDSRPAAGLEVVVDDDDDDDTVADGGKPATPRDESQASDHGRKPAWQVLDPARFNYLAAEVDKAASAIAKSSQSATDQLFSLPRWGRRVNRVADAGRHDALPVRGRRSSANRLTCKS